MQVSSLSVDFNSFFQFIFSVFTVFLSLLLVVKNTASEYIVDDANFDGGGYSSSGSVAQFGDSSELGRMPGVSGTDAGDGSCAVCGVHATKQCSGCKLVRYCSGKCQIQHWHSVHKKTCKDTQHRRKASGLGGSKFTRIALVPYGSKTVKQSEKVLFPYDEFVKLFNWEYPGFLPCGLINCGNSCFANVVLQCLTHTRPLTAYMLGKGHRQQCRRSDWCFLCEFQTHLEKVISSQYPLSLTSILSQLPNIGCNLGHGNQEDAHEFMRFAIDTMQSLCLDEVGAEKVIHPSSQETTLIQHIFGGHLLSKVICTNCNKISNQYENIMDLTVEIQGGSASLEECLDQFTAKEWLHGDNMYQCDGCNKYVKAWKRLTVRQAPNILTIALKRFQSGEFGKLNNTVTFPETLDLGPYLTKATNGTDIYKLYAVVVHVDVSNSSFFGHYICYVKDFSGYWYIIDDSEVVDVDLEEALSQKAYMLLYSRVNARPSCLESINALKKDEHLMVDTYQEVAAFKKQAADFDLVEDSNNHIARVEISPTYCNPHGQVSHVDQELRLGTQSESVREDTDTETIEPWSSQFFSKEFQVRSSTKNDAASLAEASYLKDELVSYVSDFDDNSFADGYLREDVLPNMSDGPIPIQSIVFDKATLSDDSFLGSNQLYVNDWLNSYSEELEKNEQEEALQVTSGTEDKMRKFTWGESSAEECVFSLGSLCKRPRTKSRRKNTKTYSWAESGKLAVDDGFNINCDRFLDLGLLQQKADPTNNQTTADMMNISCFSSASDEMDTVNFDKSLNYKTGDFDSVITEENASHLTMSNLDQEHMQMSQSKRSPSPNTLLQKSLGIDGENS